MAVHSDTIQKRMRAFLAACARRGVKVTHQCMEVYRELVSTAEHPDAESIHRRVQERIPTISLDTVYRKLKLLAQHGLISVVGMSHERIRFDANLKPHHHFVCVKCGLIRDFRSHYLGTLKTPHEASEFGEPLSLHVEVKGVCRTCQPDSRSR